MTNLHRDTDARVVLASVCLAALVLPIDFSGVAIASPAIGRDLVGGPLALAWVVNAFMLSFGSTLLVMGALADAHGRRRVFLYGLAGFVLVSIALCFAPSLLVLDLGRAIQGVAAAATLSGGTAALAQEFDGQPRARAMSLLGTTFGGGLAFGPTIAGLLIDQAGWRSIFLSGALVGALAFVLVRPRLRETCNPEASGVDWPGAVAFTATLATLTVGVLDAAAADWCSISVWLPLCLSVMSGVAFVFIERHVPRPMLDLTLFRIPRFLGVQMLPVATCFGYIVLLVLLPTRLVTVEGRTELQAGLIMLLLSSPMIVVPYAAARLSSRWPAWTLCTGGLLVSAAGLAALSLAPLRAPVEVLAAPLFVIGIGAAVPWGLMDALSLTVVPTERAGMATGVFSTVRVAGEGLAIAIARTVLASIAATRVVDDPVAQASIRSLTAGSRSAGESLRALEAVGDAFSSLLRMLAVLVIVAAAVIAITLREVDIKYDR